MELRHATNGVPLHVEDAPRQVVAALLNAALDPDRWPEALSSVGSHVGCDQVAVFECASGVDRGIVWASDELPLQTPWDATRSDCRSHRCREISPILPGLFTTLCVGDDLSDKTAFDASRFPFRDACQHCPALRDSCRQLSSLPGTMPLPHVALGAFGAGQTVADDPSATARFRGVIPYVEHALRAGYRLSRERFVVESAEFMFARPGEATMLCDDTGHVLHRNEAAARILARGRGLRLLPGNLLSADAPGAAAGLARAMSAGARDAVARRAPVRNVVPVMRAQGEDPYVLHVASLPPNHPFARPPLGAAIAITLQDPDARSIHLDEALRVAFALTPAECRLVNGLLDGLTTQEMASRFGLSIHTVKSQLKSIYGKSGTHRQGELIRVCMRLQSGTA